MEKKKKKEKHLQIQCSAVVSAWLICQMTYLLKFPNSPSSSSCLKWV